MIQFPINYNFYFHYWNQSLLFRLIIIWFNNKFDNEFFYISRDHEINE